ncbi:MAG: very short patch repair endonuclease [Euryarchaeota archaeon HGW-Euryarchaeota-1]|nr:MAG: very short patch repair endonuclease [Euryarchaeota archaeon HGW-Euryarchaeota-1]
MADVLTKKQRSFNMSQIRSKDTKPEIKIRKQLYKKGIGGYRVHYKLFGKPDIVFPAKKIVVFIDGCFWHKCPKCFIEPETRKEFWMKKIKGNVDRDHKVNIKLKKEGWKVLRYWEHEIKKSPERVVLKIIKKLKHINFY